MEPIISASTPVRLTWKAEMRTRCCGGGLLGRGRGQKNSPSNWHAAMPQQSPLLGHDGRTRESPYVTSALRYGLLTPPPFMFANFAILLIGRCTCICPFSPNNWRRSLVSAQTPPTILPSLIPSFLLAIFGSGFLSARSLIKAHF